MFAFYEQRGWTCEIKKNGTGSIVSIEDDVEFFTRHGVAHKAWEPQLEAKRFLRKLSDSVFAFELLHSKGGGVRDTYYFHDVLRFRGTDLVGTTLAERREILAEAMRKCPSNMGVAVPFESNFADVYRKLAHVLDEGVVLKDPKAKLRDCSREGTNAGWQVKCRKATKNFGF
jgi:ATP-dependent DNA ligase